MALSKKLAAEVFVADKYEDIEQERLKKEKALDEAA